MLNSLLEIGLFESTIMPLIGLATVIAIIVAIVIAIKNGMKSQDERDKEELAKQKEKYSKYWAKNLTAIKEGFKKYYASQIVEGWNTLDDFEKYVYKYDEKAICPKCGEKLEWDNPKYVNDTGYISPAKLDTGLRLKDDYGREVSVYRETSGYTYSRRYQVRYASCLKCKFQHFKQDNLHYNTTGDWNWPIRQSVLFDWRTPEMAHILGHDLYEYLSKIKPGI